MSESFEVVSFEDIFEYISACRFDEDDDFSEDDCQLSESSGSHRQKRKYVRKVKIVKVPRVMMFDIRKCYAKMLVNVINSHDFPLMYGFIETYFAPNVRNTVVKFIGKGDQRKKYCMSINGCDELAKYWYSFMNMSPDAVTSLNHATIQHTTGNVVTSMHKDGTQIYEVRGKYTNDYVEYILIDGNHTEEAGLGFEENSRVEVEKKRKFELTDFCEKKRRMMGIMSSVESAVSRLVLRKNPVQVAADMSMTIFTDENKRITKIEACAEY